MKQQFISASFHLINQVIAQLCVINIRETINGLNWAFELQIFP